MDTPTTVENAYIKSSVKCWKCLGTGSKPCKMGAVSTECKVCGGIGHIRANNSSKQKPIRQFKWNGPIPGPRAAFDFLDPKIAPSSNEMLCSLCGHWAIYQLENGHCFTTDDVVCAAIASKVMKSKAKTHIDIGTGLGSVLCLVRWALWDELVESIGIEAQSIHVQLAKKTIHFNGLSNTQIHHNDLRNYKEFDFGCFDMVTGTPPYFKIENGSFPTESGRGMCAFEMRGGISDYCKAAAVLLKKNSDSRFIVANTSQELFRTEEEAKNVGFSLVERWDIHGKEGKDSLFSVFVFSWNSMGPTQVHHLNIRSSNGNYSPEYEVMRVRMGSPATL